MVVHNFPATQCAAYVQKVGFFPVPRSIRDSYDLTYRHLCLDVGHPKFSFVTILLLITHTSLWNHGTLRKISQTVMILPPA